METIIVPLVNIDDLEEAIGYPVLGWRRFGGRLEVDLNAESLLEEEKERIAQLLGSSYLHHKSHEAGGGDEVALVIENRTDDPSTPVNGQIWLRTDL